MIMKKELAVITSASLGLHNGLILTTSLMAEYESGGCQNVGGIALDTYNKKKESREGTAAGCELIRQLLLFFGVSDLSEVKNHVCYVLYEGEGLARNPRGLENIAFSANDSKKSQVVYKDIFDNFNG